MLHPSFLERFRPLQVEGASFLSNSKWAILADDMGLGKSAQWIAHAHAQGGRNLIVCPSFLKYKWADEIKKWWPDKGVRIEKHIGIEKDKYFSIVSSSSLEKNAHLFEGRTNTCLDESQYFKNPSTERTKLVTKYIRVMKPENLTLLTGTPITNHIEDFWSQLRLLSFCPYRTNGVPFPENLMKKKSDFLYAFSNPTQKIFGSKRFTVFEGHRNVEYLRELLRGKYKRREKSQIKGMPKKQRNYIRVKDVWYRDKDIKDLDSLISNAENPHHTQFRKAVALEKTKYTISFVKDLMDQTSGPVIIVTDFLDSYDALLKALPGFVGIKGGMSDKERHKINTDFQNGKYKGMVASERAIPAGLDLFRSSKMVFNDFSYNPTINVQVEDRICRIGQIYDCDYYYMLFGKVDFEACIRITKKIQTITSVIRATSVADLL